jgi:Domain of unknown function (DUF222)
MLQQLLEELVELPDDALDERIRSLELQRRRLDAEFAIAVAAAGHRNLQAVDGHRSINAYLRATINCSSIEASRWRSLAWSVDHVDGLADRWLAGRLGESQAIAVANLYGNRRVRDHLSEFAPLLLDNAEQLSHREFMMCIDRFVANADEDGAHDARDDGIEHRDARVTSVGGMAAIDAHGSDALTAAELIAVHERFTEAEYNADLAARRAEHGDAADQHPLPRTAGQRRFDALVSIFRTAAGAAELGSPATPLVNIVIDADTWGRMLADAGLAPSADFDSRPIDPFTGLSRPDDLLRGLLDRPEALSSRRCETTSGITVHPHDALRAALVGHVRRIVVDADGVTIDQGRRRRLFAGAAREAAMVLIRTCEHPGCELPAEWCDIDHAVEWAQGGSTDQINARVRCGPHNAEKSRKQWRSERAHDGRTYTIRNDGTIMLPVGVRPPTFPGAGTDEGDADDPDNDAGDAEIECMNELARQRVAALRAA